VPTIYPPTIPDQYYIIESSSYNQDYVFTAFTYGPTALFGSSYTFSYNFMAI